MIPITLICRYHNTGFTVYTYSVPRMDELIEGKIGDHEFKGKVVLVAYTRTWGSEEPLLHPVVHVNE